MFFYQINAKIHLKTGIFYQNSNEVISKVISSSLINGGFSEFHNQRDIKFYVSSNFFNPQKGYYKGGKNNFLINTPKKELAKILAKELSYYEDKILGVDEIYLKKIRKKHIQKLRSKNPVIISLYEKNRYWTIDKSGDIIFFQEALVKNLVHKYEIFYNEKLTLEHSLISFLKVNPIVEKIILNSKKATLYGHKIEVGFNEDENSQKLAFLALSCGLGEKNSFGGGFCEVRNF